ncbi:MAG: DUF6786 family protein [Chthoniobacterales bacterium]
MKNPPANFGEDVAFLKEHTDVVVLRSGDAALVLAPAYQGRVMTSTAKGDAGDSYGWLNYKLIKQGVLTGDAAAGKPEAKIHVFGGEERFWLGPEGGQFGIYFAPGAKFDFADWKTPAPIDTEPFALVSSDDQHAVFGASFAVTNHSGTKFDLAVERTVRLLGAGDLSKALGVEIPADLPFVAYETVNTITNRGEKKWAADTGLLSVWILGMYKPSSSTVVAIPFREDAEGPVVNDAYFGKIAPDRLKVGEGAVFFKGDGASRGKIGIPPARATGFAGSYSPDLQSLTVVRCDPPAPGGKYVNSMWEQQKDPYSGDQINAYNDGSPAPGEPPLGPFYELETSSPGAELAPGASVTHRQITVHFTGDAGRLDPLAKATLGTGIAEIRDAFAAPAR